MIIVVDGYNILKNVLHHRMITENERRHFIALLGAYAKRKKHTIVVVFDGGPSEWVSTENLHGVMVLYAGSRKTADDVINEYVELHRAKELLVVSSDHEVGLAASQQGIPSIGSLDFYTLVKDALSANDAPHSAEVTIAEDEEDLDSLMEQASAGAAPKEDDRIMAVFRHQKNQTAKKNRILIQRLKKL